MDKLKIFFSNRTNLVLIGVLAFVFVGLFFGAQKLLSKPQVLEEVELAFDPEGPYALLVPRRDGNALNLSIFRVVSYDEFSYELVYQSSLTEVENTNAEEGSGKVDRSAGSLDTFIKLNKKSEFNQEILFGTCSQGYTTGGAHCVFDKDVENGTLTIRIKKGNKLFRMITPWHLQKPDVALGKISSADGHFNYQTDAKREELANAGWSIVNDLSGVPKLPEGKKVLGKVYAFNVPTAKIFPKGQVSIELSDNPPQDAKLSRYNDAKNQWEILDTKVDMSKLTSSVEGNGIFAILVGNSSK